MERSEFNEQSGDRQGRDFSEQSGDGEGRDFNDPSAEPASGVGGKETGDVDQPYDGGNDPSVNKPAPHNAGAGEPSGTDYDPSQGTQDERPSDSTNITGDPSSGVDTSQHQSKWQGSGRPDQEPDSSRDESYGRGQSDETSGDYDSSKKDDSGYGDDGNDGSSGEPALGPGGSGGAEGAGGPEAGSGGPPTGPPGVGGDDGPQVEKESHGEGTGEKYVKSTGTAAEGGDFDAANPGAGREADRLLESKGVHREPGSNVEETGDDNDGDDGSGKPGLKDRIKDKLHRN